MHLDRNQLWIDLSGAFLDGLLYSWLCPPLPSVEAAISAAAADAAETLPMEWTDSLVEGQLSPVRPMQPLENVGSGNESLKRAVPMESEHQCSSDSSSEESAEEESSTSDESVAPVECHNPDVICLESDEEETVLSPKKVEPKPDAAPSGSSAAALTVLESSQDWSPEIQDSQVAGDVMEYEYAMEKVLSDEEKEGLEASTQKGVFKDGFSCLCDPISWKRSSQNLHYKLGFWICDSINCFKSTQFPNTKAQ